MAHRLTSRTMAINAYVTLRSVTWAELNRRR
jgi:hypothetical protein